MLWMCLEVGKLSRAPSPDPGLLGDLMPRALSKSSPPPKAHEYLCRSIGRLKGHQRTSGQMQGPSTFSYILSVTGQVEPLEQVSIAICLFYASPPFVLAPFLCIRPPLKALGGAIAPGQGFLQISTHV